MPVKPSAIDSFASIKGLTSTLHQTLSPIHNSGKVSNDDKDDRGSHNGIASLLKSWRERKPCEEEIIQKLKLTNSQWIDLPKCIKEELVSQKERIKEKPVRLTVREKLYYLF